MRTWIPCCQDCAGRRTLSLLGPNAHPCYRCGTPVKTALVIDD